MGGGDYFKYFRQRRNIIRGRRLIEERLLFEQIRYFVLVGENVGTKATKH